MTTTMLRTGLAVALTALMATGAIAQETKRGNRGDGTGQSAQGRQGQGGQGQGGQGQRGQGQRGGNATATAPAPVTATPKPTTPSAGWLGGRGNANTPGIDREQAEHAAKIEWGQRRGLLTDAEARALKAEQDRIAELERRAKADGNVTREERQQIRGAQREAERHVAQETFDREREGRGGRRGWGHGWGHGWGRGWW